jgi:hypothetical protein
MLRGRRDQALQRVVGRAATFFKRGLQHGR